MKIIFAGTPEFAAVALARLHASGFEIPLVLTQPDRPAGRGLQPKASAVKQFALTHDIPVAQPASLRLEGKEPDQAREAHALLRGTPHDAMVVAAYGLILPPSILAIPRLGCLNIHASLLPRWRGAAPIHRAIEAGDAETGVSIMLMDAGLDTGPTLAMKRIPIAPQETTSSLHDKLAALGGTMIVEALDSFACGAVQPLPQPEIGVTYAHKISKAEAALDFTRAAALLERQIRAFNPFPGAFGLVDGTPIKIWGAEALPVADHTRHQPGEVLSADARSGIVVVCGDGALRLTELQKPGGKRLPAAEFLTGFPIAGRRFA